MYYRREDHNLFGLYRSLILESNDTEVDVIDPVTWGKLELTIRRCKYVLMKRSIFIGNVLARLKICFTNDIPTMAVDDFGNIYISPKFALSLSEEDIVSILAHEAMHIITLSFPRRRGREMKIWNIATDYIMNMYLQQDGFKFPDGFCNPVEKGGRWIIPELKGTKTIKNLDITEMSANELYDIIIQIAVPPDQQQGQGGPQEIEVGDIIRDTKTGRYGKVTSIDKATGRVTSTEIPKSEVEKHL